jgi:hypothetical protein
VTLLRLSPLLPLAASNYLYGLTSVDLGSYVAGSFLGMLPGTYAYVTTGHLGKAALMEGEGSLGVESWQVRPAGVGEGRRAEVEEGRCEGGGGRTTAQFVDLAVGAGAAAGVWCPSSLTSNMPAVSDDTSPCPGCAAGHVDTSDKHHRDFRPAVTLTCVQYRPSRTASQVALGLGVTLLAIGYVGQLAKGALEEAEKESDMEEEEPGADGARAAAGGSSNGNGKGNGASGSHANSNGAVSGNGNGNGKGKSASR